MRPLCSQCLQNAPEVWHCVDGRRIALCAICEANLFESGALHD